jgi:hypothetical protein
MWLKSILRKDRNCNGLAICQNNMRRNLDHLQGRLELPNEDINVALALADLEERERKYPDSGDWVKHIRALYAMSKRRLTSTETSVSRVRRAYNPLHRIVDRLR